MANTPPGVTGLLGYGAPPEPSWEAETYKRLLTMIGGQSEDAEFRRARDFLAELNHFFPDAKRLWDEYCASMGVK